MRTRCAPLVVAGKVLCLTGAGNFCRAFEAVDQAMDFLLRVSLDWNGSSTSLEKRV